MGCCVSFLLCYTVICNLLLLLFVVYVSCRPVMLYCLFVTALWSPAVEGGGGTGLLDLLCVVFSCVFVTFLCGVLRQV